MKHTQTMCEELIFEETAWKVLLGSSAENRVCWCRSYKTVRDIILAVNVWFFIISGLKCAWQPQNYVGQLDIA